MPKKNNIQLPSSSAGLVGMSGEDTNSNFKLSPQYVLIFIFIILLLVIFLGWFI